jgi:hypothetical protein
VAKLSPASPVASSSGAAVSRFSLLAPAGVGSSSGGGGGGGGAEDGGTRQQLGAAARAALPDHARRSEEDRAFVEWAESGPGRAQVGGKGRGGAAGRCRGGRR